MSIGRIVSVPLGDSGYAIVRDEHGTQWTVDRGQIPNGAEDGDDFAYRVDFHSRSGGPTLKSEPD